MKTKWTPGPWTVSPDWPFADERGNKHDAVVKRSESGAECLICSFEHSVMRDSQNANARLIALAPEMAEALREVFEWCKQDAENEDGYPTQEMMEARSETLRALLSRLEGGEE